MPKTNDEQIRLFVADRACHILSSVHESFPGKWIIPVNCCEDVLETLVTSNCTPIFVDIDEKTMQVDQDELTSLLVRYGSEIRGIILIATYGDFSRNEEAISVIRKNSEGIIIDDRCLSPPIISKPKSISSDLILYSTGKTKYCDLGFGGFAYSNLDINVPIVDFEVSSYLEKINQSIPSIDSHKEKLNSIYNSLLPEYIKFPESLNQWRYNILAPDNLTRDSIVNEIFNRGKFCSSHYLPLSDGAFPRSTRISRQIINLFNDFHFTEDDAILICKIINSILDETAVE